MIGRKIFEKVLTLGLCPYVAKRCGFSTSIWTVEPRFNALQQGDSDERGWFKNLCQDALR